MKLIKMLFCAVLALSICTSVSHSFVYADNTDVVGGKITLTQFLGAAPDTTKEIRLNSEAVDKATFFEIADSLILTSSLNPATTEMDGIYITAQTTNDELLYAYISPSGGADKYCTAMSRLPYAMYTVDDTEKLNSLYALAGTPTNSEVENAHSDSNDFSDIKGHWAEAAIMRLKDKNIISGYPDNSFKPDRPVTRAEFAKIVTTAFNLNEASSVDEYADVSSTDWYYPYLECAAKYIPVYPLPVSYENNIPYAENAEKGLNGFLPNTDAIRMHVAETLVEIKKEKGKINPELPSIQEIKTDLNKTFKDADYEELFAMHGTIPANVERMFEYTWLAKELKIMEGDNEGYFHPYNKVTRAELITMIDRMITE